jgi:hypothetical protein
MWDLHVESVSRMIPTSTYQVAYHMVGLDHVVGLYLYTLHYFVVLFNIVITALISSAHCVNVICKATSFII